MRLLHICAIENNKMSGMSNAVPDHFIFEKKLCNCAILNILNTENYKLKDLDDVYYYKKIHNFDVWISDFDIVIFHGVYIKEYLHIYRVIKKKNIPYIIIPHGSLTKQAQSTKRLKKFIANKMFFNHFISNSSRIQYLSDYEKKCSSNFLNKSFVCGNGIEVGEYQKKEHKSKYIDLIYVGRYSISIKGIDLMIDACANVKSLMRKNNMRLFLYGGSDDGIDKIRQMVKEKNLEGIVFVNEAIFGAEKNNNINKCDYFIQTSRTEGQPLGLIEAMSFGMPVIVSRGTTFYDIVKDNDCGYVCSTVDEISNVLKIIPNELDKIPSFSHNSYKYAKNNFTWDILAKKNVDFYLKIMEESKK